jgi:Flp pilus assembly protein TadG
MIEWMLVILPTLGIITAFFDVSFALFSWSTLQNAVREGVRYAITFQTSGSLGQDASIAQVVATNSMGLLTSSSTLIKVNYYTTTAPTTAIAAPNGNDPGNLVVVSVQQYPLVWLVPISGTCCGPGSYRAQSPASINVYSSDILGGYPAGETSVTR